MKTPDQALNRAIAIFGNQSALARKLGVTPQSVQQWIKAGRVPAKWALRIEMETARLVTRYQLRPDYYPMDHFESR